MKAEDFDAWVILSGLSEREISRVMGLSRNSVAKYRVHGAPVYIGYACAALTYGLAMWRDRRGGSI